MSLPSAATSLDRRRLLVVAALIENDGRILMSKRRADQALPNCWEFPGGKVEPGEAPEVALAREIEEELDCQVEVGRIYDVVFYKYDAFDLLMLLYRAELVSGTPKPREVAAVAWVAKVELLSLDLPPADLPLARRLTAEGN